MVATMMDVARLAGVSLKTVSNVVNELPNVRPETRAKVQAAVVTLDYQVNVSARSLSLGRTGMIALAIPEMNQPYYAQLADAVMAAAADYGLSVLIEPTGADRERELFALSMVRRRIADGLILSPLALGPQDLDNFSDRSPLVLLGETIIDGPGDHVAIRSQEAAQAATAHLLEIGRRHIALIGAPGGGRTGAPDRRTHGYEAEMANWGLPVDPRLMRSGGGWGWADGAQAARDLLVGGVKIDAVFCLNDALAIGAIREFHTHGVLVPDDIAVIGFDNTDAGRYITPSLSTVAPGPGTLARMAVEHLQAQLAQRADGLCPVPVETLVEFEILGRESTLGAAKCLPPTSAEALI